VAPCSQSAPHIGVSPIDESNRIMLHEYKSDTAILVPTSISVGQDAVDFIFGTFTATLWYQPHEERSSSYHSSDLKAPLIENEELVG